MKKRFFSAKKIAVLAIFTALSLITFLIENLFPPLFIPGAKLGLSNTFSFAALIMYSPIEAFIIVALRTVLGAIFAGNVSAVMYSFTGGIVSMAISSLLIYFVYPKLSIIAVSIVAAVCHNVTQCTVHVLVTSTPQLFFYAPYLMLIGILSGAFIGAVVWLIFKRIPLSTLERTLGEKTAAKRTLPSVGANTEHQAVTTELASITEQEQLEKIAPAELVSTTVQATATEFAEATELETEETATRADAEKEHDGI